MTPEDECRQAHKMLTILGAPIGGGGSIRERLDSLMGLFIRRERPLPTEEQVALARFGKKDMKVRCRECRGTGYVLTDFVEWLSKQGWKLEEQEMSELITPAGKVMPTIGRIMHYHTSQNGEPLTLPAVVTTVHPPHEEDKQNVNLVVFGLPDVASEYVTEIRLVQPGDGDAVPLPYCEWPPRD